MFDASFVRMWRMFLNGCAANFRYGDIRLYQVLFTNGLNNAHAPHARVHVPLMEPITTVASSLQAVKARIARAAQSVDRQPDEITLLVASKTHPAERVREAWLAGQTIFGENYLQEALAKMPALADLPIEWHFIGPIQSNKTKRITENFVWVHGVDRIKIADRLAKDRPESLPPLQICLQVNVSGEA